jgi:hypothetical protein
MEIEDTRPCPCDGGDEENGGHNEGTKLTKTNEEEDME